jgi:hypothetical protein
MLGRMRFLIYLCFKSNNMNKNQHVVKHPEGWAVKGAGNEKATKVTPTQKEAIDVAKGIAKNQHSEVVIHGENGKIRDKDSYGNDPSFIKDKKH